MIDLKLRLAALRYWTYLCVTTCYVACCALPLAAWQIDPLTNASPDIRQPVQSNHWLVLVCGLPGDDEHRERLTDAVRKIASAAEPVFMVDESRLKVLVGDEIMADALRESAPAVATQQSLQATLKELRSQIQPSDSCCVMLLGHGQLYKGRSTFNVQGPDFDGMEFAKWMQPINCSQKSFLLTMPVSGFWLKALAADRTICITATESGLEFTGTEMPYALADVVSGQDGAISLEDIDQDGQVSLLDLYLAVNIEIHNRFKSMERLQSEHAQLDDNGDGIGKELQSPYLPVELANGELAEVSVRPPPIRTSTANSDGDLARQVLLRTPVLPKN